jgi:hypothetical protein
MPGGRCTRGLACENNKHASIVTTGSPGHPGIPCTMVLRFPSRSPRGPGFLAPVDRESLHDLGASVGAPEPHDFSVRSARPRQLRAPASTASRARRP